MNEIMVAEAIEYSLDICASDGYSSFRIPAGCRLLKAAEDAVGQFVDDHYPFG